MEPKNTELAKKKTVFNTFEYGYFWKFADTVTSLKRSNIWSTWIQLMSFLPAIACIFAEDWTSEKIQKSLIWHQSTTDSWLMVTLCRRDAIGTPDGIFHPSNFDSQPEVAISGKCLRKRENNYNPKMLSSSKIFDIWEFLHLKDEKNGAASGFSACFKHQGLSNPKLHWCCAGGTIHGWGLDSIKKIASCCRRSGATGSFYTVSQRLCRFAYSFYIIIHHHCIQYYNTKDHPFPAARMDVSFVHLLGQHICRSPTWSGRHAKDEHRVFEGKKWLGLFFRKVTTECHRRLFNIIPWNSNRNVSNHGGLSATMISLAGTGWRVWRAKDVAGRLICSVHLPCLPPATSWTWQLARIVLLQWIRIQFICFSKIVILLPLSQTFVSSNTSWGALGEERLSGLQHWIILWAHLTGHDFSGKLPKGTMLPWWSFEENWSSFPSPISRMVSHGCSSCMLMWMAHLWTKEPKL